MVEGSVGACHGGPYGAGAALRTASMSSARASASASPMAISAFRYSGCRACGAGIRGCRRDDRACWPDVREEQPAPPAGRPGSDRFRGHPHRHIAASNESLIVGRPVRHPILRLIPGMNLRLHPRSVAPAEGPEKCGPRRPTRSGYSCNNAPRQRLGNGRRDGEHPLHQALRDQGTGTAVVAGAGCRVLARAPVVGRVGRHVAACARSRTGSSVSSGRGPRRTDGRCPAPAARPYKVIIAAVRAFTAVSRATLSWRMISTAPSAVLGTAVDWPASTDRAAASASIVSDLPAARRKRRSPRFTSVTRCPARRTARARPAP